MTKRKTLKAVLVGVVLSALLVGGVAAYTMFTGTATGHVNEPFTITNIATSSGSCTSTSSTASCSLGNVFPGASGTISFTVNNAATISETPIVIATSNDTTNIPVTVSHISAISGSSSEVITLSYTVAAATPPEAFVITWSVGR